MRVRDIRVLLLKKGKFTIKKLKPLRLS